MEKSPHLRARTWGLPCIMVAHAVYSVVSLPAGSTEHALGGSHAVDSAGHAARGTAAERAAGSCGGRSCHTAVAAAESAAGGIGTTVAA